jgi:hypothetical protein
MNIRIQGAHVENWRDTVISAIEATRPAGQAWSLTSTEVPPGVLRIDFSRDVEITLAIPEDKIGRRLLYRTACHLLREDWPGALEVISPASSLSALAATSFRLPGSTGIAAPPLLVTYEEGNLTSHTKFFFGGQDAGELRFRRFCSALLRASSSSAVLRCVRLLGFTGDHNFG